MQPISTVAMLAIAFAVSACDSASISNTQQIEDQQTGAETVTETVPVPVDIDPVATLPSQQLLARSGDPIANVLAITTPLPTDALLTVSPALPAGLALDSQSAIISGTPESEVPNQDYTVSNNGTVLDIFSMVVGPELPEAIQSLDDQYSAKVLVADAAIPVKMARSSDGRIFYIELITGNVRIIDPSLGLLPTPFTTVAVSSGADQGLFGLALDPDFDSNGHVYLHATVPGQDGGEVHAEVIRVTDVQNVGTNASVIIDDIPIAVHNGGPLVFDKSGNLFVARGDVADPTLAQTTGDLAGKILRYTSTGGIPADNPLPGDPEWVRGLRNTFAMTLHPVTGDLFGGDSGAVANDKITYLEAGVNFGWGLGEDKLLMASETGLVIQTWDDAVTPTALMFHTGTGQPEFENNLFYAAYSKNAVNRLVLTGANFTDLVSEEEFVGFVDDGDNNRPMHIIEADDGGVYIATLSTIYHVYPTAIQ